MRICLNTITVRWHVSLLDKMELQQRDHGYFFTSCYVRKDGLVGYDGRFTRGRSRVRFPIFVHSSFFACSFARWTGTHMCFVMDSTPDLCTLHFCLFSVERLVREGGTKF